MVRSIYINLPIENIERTRAFWTALGFSFNEQFSDDNAVCLVLCEGSMYAMLIQDSYFSTFTPRIIADDSTSQVLIAIEVENREKVDYIVSQALSNGGSRYKESQDHSWMYYDTFADPDGHQWEVMSYNSAAIPS